jgi:signal transduction histidine kinase
MTSITGFIELLQDGEAGPLTPDQERFLEAIRRNSDRLTALANDLLSLSGLEAETVIHEQVPVDVGHVISAVQATLEPVIAARCLEVTFQVPAGPVMVRGDYEDLGSLVSNLLSNAMKFTMDGGWVRCGLRVVFGHARLEVSDNGLGIPEKEQGDLFSRFFRSSTAHEHAIQGSGLGLTIVDSIVKSHGGDISVVSEHLGGSTFTVNLPLIDA